MAPVLDPRFQKKRIDWKADARSNAIDIERKEYQKAGITLAVCFAINVVLIFGIGGGVLELGSEVSAMLYAAVYSIRLVFISIAALLGIMVMCSLLGTGAGPLWLGLLRLGAVVSCADTVAFVPLGCFTTVLYIFALVILMQIFFDFDTMEAALATILTCVFCLAIPFVLIAVLGVIL